MSFLPKLIHSFNTVPIKIPAGCFKIEIETLILKYMWRCKESRIAETTLKKNIIQRLTLPDVKAYFKGRLIKTVLLGLPWWRSG